MKSHLISQNRPAGLVRALLDRRVSRDYNRSMARSLILLVVILVSGVARATTLKPQALCSYSQADFDTTLQLGEDKDWQALNAWRHTGHFLLAGTTKSIDLGEIPGDIGVHRVRVFGTFQILYTLEDSIIDENTTTPTVPAVVPAPTAAASLSRHVISAVTDNRWTPMR